jgi:hypothetical protein
MFRQREGVEPFVNGCLDNFIERVFRMAAKLPRVAVV